METGFARADARLEQRITELRSELRTGLAQADAKLEQVKGQLSTDLHKVRADISWKPLAA